jgi:hypothetical protein
MDADRVRNNEWPELVGTDVDAARLAILAARPGLHVHPVSLGTVVTADYRTNRVWLWFEEETQRVARVPRVG